MTYLALNRQHVTEANITGPRRSACATKIHALIFTLIEDADVSAFDLPSRESLLRLAQDKAAEMHRSGAFGFAGWFMSATILQWLVSALFNVVFSWLLKQLQDWIDANKSQARMACQSAILRTTTMTGYFTAARAMLAGGAA